MHGVKVYKIYEDLQYIIKDLWTLIFRGDFEDLCPGTWVTHFDRKFQYEKFKAEVFSKGFDAVDIENAKRAEETKS